jgi:hypothetical protein
MTLFLFQSDRQLDALFDRRFSSSREVECPNCDGSGIEFQTTQHSVKCFLCKGQGQCQELDVLFLEPHSTPEIEAAIWQAVTDCQRDWTAYEQAWIAAHLGLTASLIDWYRCNSSDAYWTEANQKFITQWHELQASITDSTPDAGS